MTCKLRRVLAGAILAALGVPQPALALELDNFDINAASAKRADAGADAATSANVDAIGRETFTWVGQALEAKQAVTEPEAAARAHLAQLLTRAKLDAQATSSLADVRVDVQAGGAALVRMQPRLGGVAIFHEEIALLMDARRSLVAMRGPLPRNTPATAKSLVAFRLDAKQAVAAALAPYRFAPDVTEKLVATRVDGEYTWLAFGRDVKSASGATSASPPRAKRVYFRTKSGLEPAWYVETSMADAGEAPDGYAHVVSAVDGRLLFRMNQTSHATANTYRVWAEGGPLGQPYPGPQGRANTPDPDGLPTHDEAPFAPQELRTLASAPFSRAETDGWLPPGAQVTSGNNVNAYADLAEPTGLGPGDVQPALTAPNTFDYVYAPALEPTANATQSQAAAVQLFYWNNWLHDWFYDSGFKERDGNAQVDNYGRGGIAGDAILAEAQDYALRNNASMLTPADGAAPRMTMGLFTATPNRDSTLDGVIVAHEWGHYLSHRLVGDSSGLYTEHARGLGEGWSDFVSLLARVKDEDRARPSNASFNGAYSSGGSGYIGDTYHGVRRYPYSTDPAKNPLGVRHLSDGVALPTDPAPRFGAAGANNSEVHAQGEIWAAMLWECYASLLNDRARLSFAEAQRRMKDYLVASLKLTPVAPTMTEARDAVLAAVLASGSQEDFALFTAAFAKRGLGAGALIPDRFSSDMVGVVESRSTGSHVAVTSVDVAVPVGCDVDPVLDAGETSRVSIAVSNTGFTALPSSTVTLASSHPGVTFPSGATVDVGALPVIGKRTVSLPIALAAGVPTNTVITLTATPAAPGVATPASRSFVIGTSFDQRERISATETFDGTYGEWRNARDRGGEGDAVWVPAIEGAAAYLHGPDMNETTVTWIETPNLQIGNDPLVVTLRHRYSFEAVVGSTTASQYYDGGVIQLSTDGGATWADIDAGVTGYGGTLSNCCRNPYAGTRAYTDRSPNYPAFGELTIFLSTAYRGETDLKLRFGVATDHSIARRGWDIDTVSFQGLAETPFSGVVAQAASCSIGSHKPLQSAMSGTYYTASRSGEGVLVDFGRLGETPVVFFSWYTYDGGRQQWLVGSSTYSPNDTAVVVDLVSTRGTSFGSRFVAENVVRVPWGSVSLSFPTCDTLALSYRKADGEMGTQVLSRGFERSTPAECPAQGGLAGTYYGATRSGEGVLVDFGRLGGAPYEFFTWYTYDRGEQQWLVGSQPYTPGERSTLELFRTSGARFGTAFRREDVQTTPWGKVTQRFTNCDTLELAYEKTGGESGTIVLQRGLERLGDGQCR